MGTRALVRVFEGKKEGKELLCLYRQFDGYPEGLGREVRDFVLPLQITNGIRGDGKGTANGAGCLAAQLVKHLKEGVGGLYVHAPGSDGEEFTYHVLVPNYQELEAGDVRAEVRAFDRTGHEVGIPK
jgi:hypothetical protein